jgi:hypothetical protein
MDKKIVHHPRQLYEIPAHDSAYINVANLKEYIEQHFTGPPKEFTPHAWYNRDGDMFEVYWSDKPCVAHEEGGLTVMRSQQDWNVVVGVKFHSVKKLMGLVEVKEELQEHKWKLGTRSLSSDWTCEVCGEFTTGGPHDGGGYYPQRGQEKTYCLGSPEKRLAAERAKYKTNVDHPLGCFHHEYRGVPFSIQYEPPHGFRFEVPSTGAYGLHPSREEALRMAEAVIDDTLVKKEDKQ